MRYKSDKITNQIIELLEKNGKMKAKDIIEILNLKNVRSIGYYKKRILEKGINIKSDGGFNGGYYIENNVKLTEKEIRQIYLSELPPDLKDKIIKKMR